MSEKVQVTHKRWREYSIDEIEQITQMKCRGCRYSKILVPLRGGRSIRYCDYLHMAGKPRGCRPDVCDKWEEKTGDYRERTPWYEPYK